MVGYQTHLAGAHIADRAIALPPLPIANRNHVPCFQPQYLGVSCIFPGEYQEVLPPSLPAKQKNASYSFLPFVSPHCSKTFPATQVSGKDSA